MNNKKRKSHTNFVFIQILAKHTLHINNNYVGKGFIKIQCYC